MVKCECEGKCHSDKCCNKAAELKVRTHDFGTFRMCADCVNSIPDEYVRIVELIETVS